MRMCNFRMKRSAQSHHVLEHCLQTLTKWNRKLLPISHNNFDELQSSTYLTYFSWWKQIRICEMYVKMPNYSIYTFVIIYETSLIKNIVVSIYLTNLKRNCRNFVFFFPVECVWIDAATIELIQNSRLFRVNGVSMQIFEPCKHLQIHLGLFRKFTSIEICMSFMFIINIIS